MKPIIKTYSEFFFCEYHNKIMQPELFQPSWPCHHPKYSIPNHPGSCGSATDFIVDDYHDFSSSFTINEDLSEISLESILSTLFSDEVMEFPTLGRNMLESLPTNTTADTIGMLESISSLAFEDVCKWFNENNKEEDASPELLTEADALSPCFSLESSEISEIMPMFPGDDMDVNDGQRSLHHLVVEYGEAMGNGYRELVEVIAKYILEKINPIGKAGERVAFHLLQPLENLGGYLREESSKNIEAAFKVFYQSFPYGRVAHYTANAAILEAIPDDVDTVHIIDFDMGDGIQWPPMIEAISQKHVALKFTSIKLEDEYNHAAWKFEETKKQLYDHARSFGLKLQVEQIGLDDLVTELKRMKKRGKKREWFAFNCMIGLPHMERRRHTDHLVEFLNSAKVFLADYANHRGILTFGDGEAGKSPKTCSDYASFFSRHFMHYQALFDSMERNFPVYLAEARIAMESLFVAPYICSVSWFQQWKEINECFDIREGNRLEGRKLSKESIIEAKEMVSEANSSYKIKVEGENENEMVLEWRGTPLVRVSSWI